MEVVCEVRRLVQDTSTQRHTDAEIVSLIAREKSRIFAGCGPVLSVEQHEAVAILVAFRLLQARDAASQLESLATCQS